MSKPGGDPSSGMSLGDALRRPRRHPACLGGRSSTRLLLIGDAKGKGASGSEPRGRKYRCAGQGRTASRRGDEASVMLVERRERAIAIWLGSTGNGRNPMFNGRRQPSRGGTSRMTRECQVRFCERLGVKFPGPTRHSRRLSQVRGMSASPQNSGRIAALQRTDVNGQEQSFVPTKLSEPLVLRCQSCTEKDLRLRGQLGPSRVTFTMRATTRFVPKDRNRTRPIVQAPP